jgi:hypothetical protein
VGDAVPLGDLGIREFDRCSGELAEAAGAGPAGGGRLGLRFAVPGENAIDPV